jgi:hypothetical protein
MTQNPSPQGVPVRVRPRAPTTYGASDRTRSASVQHGVPHLLRAALLALLLLALTATASAAGQLEQLHFILRPDAAGQWYIQNDHDHASIGVKHKVEQRGDRLHVRFERTYAKAVVIQITSDDGFADRISGHASLGTSEAVIVVVARGKGAINPRDVWQHVGKPGNGNLWVSITMLEPK